MAMNMTDSDPAYPEPMTNAKAKKPPSQSAARTLTVLEQLAESSEGLTLTALASETKIPLATCASIVYTLEERGYASRTVIGRSHFWRATMRLYGMASQLMRKVDLANIAPVEMDELAESLAMPIHIGVLDGASVVYVAKAATTGFVQFDTYPGKMAPFNLTALGKAIVAFLPQDRLDPLLPQMEVGQGPGALGKGVEPFLEQLVQVRKRGFAIEVEEERADFSCVAAPLFGSDDEVVGAVGVTGFSRDLGQRAATQAGRRLVTLANLISTRLGHLG